MIRDRVKELRRVRAEITPDMEVPVLIVDLDDDEATLVLATHDPLGVMAHLESVQIVTFAGTATGGTFTLKCLHYTGVEVTTAALAYNATTATILAAVNAVLGTSAVAIAAADTMPNDALTFTFSGANYAGKPQRLILPNIALMTGGTPTVTVVETGDIHWRMY